MRILFSVAVWGKDYLRTFVEYSLASQLAPANIPRLAEKHDLTYHITTTRSGGDWLRQQPAIGFLTEHCWVEWSYPAALIFFSMTIPLTALTAILFARYRDLPRLVSSLMVVILLLTPVFWMPTMVKGWRSAIFYANPIYYGVEFLRAPLLGKPPDILVISVFLSMTAIVWVVGSFFYRRFHRYVAFWV